MAGIPVIAHVHGINQAFYYRFCRHLVAVSNAVANHLTLQGIPRERVSILLNGLPGVVRIGPKQIGSPFVIAIVAKLHRNKGHHWALDALASSFSQLPACEIWIFGNGPERQNLLNDFGPNQFSGRIKFWGYKQHLDNFYPYVHLVLLPSLSEGMPLSLLEAMKWGIPCIASRVGGVPELIEDGVNGFLVNPGNGNELVAAIQKTLEPSKWYFLSQGARRSFVSKNHFSNLIDGLERKINLLTS
ncbi:glycosyltransferase family 4 protein [bacterium]|nr:glycosyltransferase family 4 protein [bacterium]